MGSLNCKGYRNNEFFVKTLITKHDIIFLSETWIGDWDPMLMCEIRKSGARIITTSNSKIKKKKRDDMAAKRHG